MSKAWRELVKKIIKDAIARGDEKLQAEAERTLRMIDERTAKNEKQ